MPRGAAGLTHARARGARRVWAGYFWLPQLGSCLFLFTYNETVKWFIRNRPRGFAAKHLAW